MIWLFLFVVFYLWCLGPALGGVYLACVHGYNATCEVTWWLRPGAPVGVEFTKTRIYWCPVGMVGYEMEIGQ